MKFVVYRRKYYLWQIRKQPCLYAQGLIIAQKLSENAINQGPLFDDDLSAEQCYPDGWLRKCGSQI